MGQRQPRCRLRLSLWRTRAARDAPQTRLRDSGHRAPADPQHSRRLISKYLQSVIMVGGGDVVDQLQLAVGFQQPGVRPDGVHPDTVEAFGRRDQSVGHRAVRQIDHQIVDGVSGSALDDVEGQDVGADRA
ncbi:hypothetical protein MSAR_00280 [Mycolicibacterium sarraceniae]|uniref:Uncharacterized protein n=1 Tax=Mycolicibacterium sarraceniae TaxID=1534348 RepID=A0A7I7SIX4_9MYCO|nr:hypothetical protein MSAR_00280 [Mycolicibacterium sarraceniae]